MKTTERTILWTAIGLLGAVNLVLVLSSTGRTAFAESAAFIADVLGPAEGVTLVEGDKELTLRARDGRLAWGDAFGVRD